MKKKNINKQIFKKIHNKCAICNLSIASTLDVHRYITEGKDGGEYTESNSLVLCVLHHRMVHSGEIVIKGVYNSTGGKVITYNDENGQEIIKFI